MYETSDISSFSALSIDFHIVATSSISLRLAKITEGCHVTGVSVCHTKCCGLWFKSCLKESVMQASSLCHHLMVRQKGWRLGFLNPLKSWPASCRMTALIFCFRVRFHLTQLLALLEYVQWWLLGCILHHRILSLRVIKQSRIREQIHS